MTNPPAFSMLGQSIPELYITGPYRWWFPLGSNPRQNIHAYLGQRDVSFIIATATKLGVSPFDEDIDDNGGYPTLDDANSWLGDIKLNYPGIDPNFTGYSDFGPWQMFSAANFGAQYQLFDPLTNEPNAPNFPNDRARSQFDNRIRDFPSPWDFNMVIFSMAARKVFQVKKALQIARISSFAKHGGRPPKP